MQRAIALGLGLAAGLLAGCAAPPPPAPDDASAAAPAPAPATTGSSVLSILGTPFLIAFKIPVCVVTVAVAAPLAGLSEITTTADTDGRDMRRQLAYGISSNCGPPWVVSP